MNDGLERNPLVSRRALVAHHADAFAWALSLTAYDAAAAADVMQQSYLVIVDGSARFDARSSLKTWLFGVVRRCAHRSYRRLRRDAAFVGRVAAEPRDDGATADEPRRTDIGAALATLSRRQRDVLELVVFSEFTVEEAAAVLDISIGSARTHYHRAKAALRERLGDDGD